MAEPTIHACIEFLTRHKKSLIGCYQEPSHGNKVINTEVLDEIDVIDFLIKKLELEK